MGSLGNTKFVGQVLQGRFDWAQTSGRKEEIGETGNFRAVKLFCMILCNSRYTSL